MAVLEAHKSWEGHSFQSMKSVDHMRFKSMLQLAYTELIKSAAQPTCLFHLVGNQLAKVEAGSVDTAQATQLCTDFKQLIAKVKGLV